MTGPNDWVFLRVGDRITGIHSRSEREPLRKSGFPERYKSFEGTMSYSAWVFAAQR